MEIKLLLEKYKNFGYSQKRIQEITSEIFSQFSIILEPQDIEIKEYEIRIKVSGVRKVEYVLLKSKIQEVLLLEFKKEGFNIKEIL